MSVSDDTGPATAAVDADGVSEAPAARESLSPPSKPNEGDPQKRSTALLIAAAVTLLAASFTGYAFMPAHAGTKTFYIIMASGYGLLTVAALVWLVRNNQLSSVRPKGADFSLGAIAGATLYMVASGVRLGLLPQETVRHSWLVRIYMQLSDPRLATPVYVGFAVLLIAASEELVWRGWVQRALTVGFGAKRALWTTTVLYTVAHVSTVYLLRVPNGGLNPLLVATALGCGLLWGTLASRLERAVPSIVCHAIFSWAVIRWPLFG